MLGAELKILGAQLQIVLAPTLKQYLTLQKEQVWLHVAIIKESGYFTQELSLDITTEVTSLRISFQLLQCCLPHL